ncbi:MAG: pancreas/duodenum homeobox protein 1 [Deltaproteobacteria bacterium]
MTIRKRILTDAFLAEILPSERADTFFDAIYGGAEEGAFDISLKEVGLDEGENELHLEYLLTERPGKCIACSLTYGLPQVFERHPVIDIAGTVERIGEALKPKWKITGWRLGATRAAAPKVHSIPFVLKLQKI